MRKTICKFFNTLLNPLKLTVLKTKEYDQITNEKRTLIKLYNNRKVHLKSPKTSKISCVIFSKDRAMQLHALLCSFLENIQPTPKTYILYHTSSLYHQESYNDLINFFSGTPIHFIKQQGDITFKQDLVEILSTIRTDKIFFLVDDILVIEKTKLDPFLKLDTNTFIPSLRMGKNLSHCYTVQKKQHLPIWLTEKQPDTNMLVWKWSQGEHDWGYPLSVDGHIFQKEEIEIIIKHADFSAPNSLEDALQIYKSIFIERYGVCYKKSKIINIPYNKVQNENKNISGEIDTTFLNKKWQQGLQMDFRKIYGFVNVSAHQEIDIEFTYRPKRYHQ